MTEAKQIEIVLFEAARQLEDLGARAAFLDQVCGGNEELRARLEKLLRIKVTAEEFFSVPAVDLIGGEEAIPTIPAISTKSAATSPSERDQGTPLETVNVQVGRYKLLERLGEGGCGVVYLAEQQEPVRRKVALKIIRLGMDTERVIARFGLERQALALMNHPNIARVFDAGATDSGRPYFVMELVSGVKITDYCDEQHLGTRQRLELFIQVCLAIQHAHQKGILHRDIKPSNVLVAIQDGAPVPKIIDFGIAKAVEGPLEETSLTVHDQLVGTPAYMSPEQAGSSGNDVDTRSDIYSLGALLYQILTGRPPFDSKQLMESGLEEMRRTLRECEPPAPSNLLLSLSREDLAAVASRHHSEPAKLLGTLQGDLDWVVMKALEKDRQRRYATANGLATDLQRYLNNEPVSARPPSRVYRLQKLVRRNRATFVAIAAVAVALMIGLGTSTWLFIREREARKREAHLRTQAQKSETISRAVFLTREGNMDGANTLLEAIDTPPNAPSLDGVSAYRAVGEWLASQQRWKEALGRFAAVMKFNRLDLWNPVTLDYQAYGVLLMETGDFDGYARFREKAVADYATSTNGDAVGRVLKSCLLRPMDAQVLARLRPMGGALEAWFLSQDEGTKKGWAAVPVSLWWYRTGNYRRAADTARQAYGSGLETSVLKLTVRLIFVMAKLQSGQAQEAQGELKQARGLLENGFPAKWNQMEHSPGWGAWYDWVFARILLREATELSEKTSPDSARR